MIRIYADADARAQQVEQRAFEWSGCKELQRRRWHFEFDDKSAAKLDEVCAAYRREGAPLQRAVSRPYR
jgi:hypothetical protein